jgi:hypothetical protein
MMLRSISLFLALILPLTSFARMPQLPDLSQWDALSEEEKAEAGAFMLFYELTSSGKIGGNSGLCLSYGPGDTAGTPGKISIGLDSKSYPTGIASLEQVPQEKLANLRSLLKQVGRYLDSGCQPGKEAECRAKRNVTITGYADAQHYGAPGKNAGRIEESIRKNEELAQKRAGLFAQVINGEGFVPPNQVKSLGKASPMGEYLQEGLAVPQHYSVGGQSPAASSFRVDCPQRRVTVIEVEFNANQLEVESKAGIISPTVKSASANFVQLANMGAAIQISKAAQALNMRSPSRDADLDKLIDKIMEINGITDPSIRTVCKNTQTRVMIQEHLKSIDKLPQVQRDAIWNDFTTKSEEEILRLAQTPTGDPSYRQNRHLVGFKGSMKGFGGVAAIKTHPLLGTSGQSTSLNDCFSAAAAMQTELSANNSLRSQACKPVKDFMKSGDPTLEVKFHPHELQGDDPMHIGCQACKTGFRYVPEQYINPETGKQEKRMVPVFIDREANIGNKDRPELNTYRPIQPEEAKSLVTTVKRVKADTQKTLDKLVVDVRTEKDATKKKQMNDTIKFLRILQGMTKLGHSSKQPETVSVETLNAAGITAEDYAAAYRIHTLFSGTNYGKVETDYVSALYNGTNTSDIIKRYEEVILPGIKTRDTLSNWFGDQPNSAAANLTFGAMKKPRFYLVENCNCDSPTLVQDAIKKGKSLTIDQVPYSNKQLVNPNACLVSIPVPPSCTVQPNEDGAADKDQKPAESKIRWMGMNGELMDKAISAMQGHFENSNKTVKVSGCEGLNPMQVAQRIVDSAECSGENRLPQGEAIDCRK